MLAANTLERTDRENGTLIIPIHGTPPPEFLHAPMERLTNRLSAAAPRNPKGAGYPYIMHRAYLCGHPDEWIKVHEIPGVQPRRLQHTLVSAFVPGTRELRMAYDCTLERCPRCADEHQAQRRQERPYECTRSLAANQGEVQSSEDCVKDGFLHVLRRERFGSKVKSERPVRWIDEGDQNKVYRMLREMHVKTEAERGIKQHERIYEDERPQEQLLTNSDRRKRYVTARRVTEKPETPPWRQPQQRERAVSMPWFENSGNIHRPPEEFRHPAPKHIMTRTSTEPLRKPAQSIPSAAATLRYSDGANPNPESFRSRTYTPPTIKSPRERVLANLESRKSDSPRSSVRVSGGTTTSGGGSSLRDSGGAAQSQGGLSRRSGGTVQNSGSGTSSLRASNGTTQSSGSGRMITRAELEKPLPAPPPEERQRRWLRR